MISTGDTPYEGRRLRRIPVGGGRTLVSTPVFESYWRFAYARQVLFTKRVLGEPPPWTNDPVLAAYRFTNAYRAADRVSQFLIRNVIYDGEQAPEEVLFRTLLFKFFNRIDTWRSLTERVGIPTWRRFSLERYAGALDDIMSGGQRVYSAAYIMPSPPFGEARKHRNHLHLLEAMMRGRVTRRLAVAGSLSEVFALLRAYPSLGDFLAFQFTIDLNYSEVIDFSEMDFVVAGPGAKDGIRKCFADAGGLSEAELIRVVAEMADEEFGRIGAPFPGLWGRKLQLIDCQNLFCEVDKYARVVHPEAAGHSGRTRIKQRFSASHHPLPQWYPPKWGLTPPDAAMVHEGTARGGFNSVDAAARPPWVGAAAGPALPAE